METTHKLFFVFLLMCFFKQGWAQCSLSNIGVSLSKTGRFVVNKPEWEVIISNNCVCSQSDLKLQCTGFTSAEQVDPVVFRKIDGQYCLVNAGLPVFQGQPISFKYAGDVMYDLPPAVKVAESNNIDPTNGGSNSSTSGMGRACTHRR